MKCSDCSRVVKPVVAVDIDGTMGDYHTHFLEFLKGYLGIAGSIGIDYTGQTPFKVWAMETYGIDERTWQDVKLAYRQGAQKRTMPIYPWAQPMCEFIRLEGAELWVTTTRPYLRLDNIDPDTRAWLRQHGIEYDGLIYDKYKYKKLSENVSAERVVAVVEDLDDKLVEARAEFGPGVPLKRLTYYNWVADQSLRVITMCVIERIRQWKELHP